jgi:hypothetical protein
VFSANSKCHANKGDRDNTFTNRSNFNANDSSAQATHRSPDWRLTADPVNGFRHREIRPIAIGAIDHQRRLVERRRCRVKLNRVWLELREKNSKW